MGYIPSCCENEKTQSADKKGGFARTVVDFDFVIG